MPFDAFDHDALLLLLGNMPPSGSGASRSRSLSRVMPIRKCLHTTLVNLRRSNAGTRIALSDTLPRVLRMRHQPTGGELIFRTAPVAPTQVLIDDTVQVDSCKEVVIVICKERRIAASPAAAATRKHLSFGTAAAAPGCFPIIGGMPLILGLDGIIAVDFPMRSPRLLPLIAIPRADAHPSGDARCVCGLRKCWPITRVGGLRTTWSGTTFERKKRVNVLPNRRGRNQRCSWAGELLLKASNEDQVEGVSG